MNKELNFGESTILRDICANKLKKLNEKGYNLGIPLPLGRKVPIIKPSSKNLIIAEIKRASPSAGYIGKIKDPIWLAKQYLESGADVISVLCEEDYFKGSLQDLIDIKNEFPNSCILRKDFILKKEEIKISFEAGADIVLLIVNVFISNFYLFIEILNEIEKYGLSALIEIHNFNELNLILDIKTLKNHFIGINSRDLKSFKINKMNAFRLRSYIDCNVIFESGIESNIDAYNVGSAGFNGILCGSYLVSNIKKNSLVLKELKDSFIKGTKSLFLKKFNEKLKINRPLIKACGINDLHFLQNCIDKVSLIGFILTPKSARYVNKNFVLESRNIKSLNNPLRIGVVMKDSFDIGVELFNEGLIDCLQLHEEIIHDELIDFYEVKKIANFLNCKSPFCLIDESLGSGAKLNLKSINKSENLCLAGGINQDNLNEFLKLDPILIDICSAFESKKGIKDINKFNSFFDKLSLK